MESSCKTPITQKILKRWVKNLENWQDFYILEHDRIRLVSEVPVSNMQIVCTSRKRLQVKMAKRKSDSSLLHESITFFYAGFPLANFFARNDIYIYG
jgi:transcriptional regulator of met regulon